jgi:cellulose synthase (UDP-forming)
VYQATAAMIAAFALPHLMHASITNSRMQGRFRHSFWNEVYESVLAWYILRPVLVAFINPRLGKFNVTAKGGVIDRSYFDWGIARPYIFLMAVNLVGLAIGLVKFSSHSGEAASTLAINLVWTVYNVIIIGASIAVASESRQVRRTPRVDASLRAVLTLSTGRTVVCKTEDFSQTGLGLLVPESLELPLGETLYVALFRNEEEASFPAEVVFRKGPHLGLQFQEMSLPQQAALTQMTFARADLWASSWGHGERDTPLRALAGVMKIGVKGFGIFFKNLYAMVSTPRAQRQPGSKLDTGK